MQETEWVALILKYFYIHLVLCGDITPRVGAASVSGCMKYDLSRNVARLLNSLKRVRKWIQLIQCCTHVSRLPAGATARTYIIIAWLLLNASSAAGAGRHRISDRPRLSYIISVPKIYNDTAVRDVARNLILLSSFRRTVQSRAAVNADTCSPGRSDPRAIFVSELIL